MQFEPASIKRLIEDRQYETAIELCNEKLSEATATEIDQTVALQFLGTAFYFSGKLSKSIECFKKILVLNPKHTDAAISLSVIYNDIGKYDDAKKVYQIANQALQLKKPGNDFLLDRKFSIKHIELGDLYFKFHRYDEALDDYSKAQQLDPNQTLTRIKIAKVYAKKGFVSRAIQELQQLCIENETDVEARVQLGLMHFSQGNVIDAQIEWEKAREIEPGNKEVSTYLSMARQATETSL